MRVQRKGKVYIAQALVWMLLTDDLEDIKINDLCRKAGVSRMTYYRYFNEKSEVLEFYMDYLFEEFLKEEDKKFPKKAFRSIEHIVDCLEYFKEQSAFAICLYKAGLEGVMLKAINRYMSLKLEEEIEHRKENMRNLFAKKKMGKKLTEEEEEELSHLPEDHFYLNDPRDEEYLRKQLQKKSYILYAYAGAIYNCYMQWILDDFKIDVYELAQIISHS